jgi:heme exporter protein A
MLEVRNLSKVFFEQNDPRNPGLVALYDITLSVRKKEFVCLLGPSGCGKTTLIRIIAGLLAPTAGTVALDGGDGERGLGEQCHYVGHLNAVKASLTVEENARFWGRYLGGGDQRLEPALSAFGLDGLRDIPAGYLSAGQKRRLGLARLLIAERPIWLLDEPTASLDSASQQVLAGAVNAHLARGGLVVAATHAPLAYANARELALGAARAA